MLRLFVAIDLPEKVKEEISSKKGDFNLEKVRWVKKENLHLTLKFLGNVNEKALSSIKEALKRIASDTKAFKFKLQGFGAFPTPKRARVLWVGISEGNSQVITLAEKVDYELSRLGFEREKRKFHPHITLARLKKPASLHKFPSLDKEIEIKADEIVLFQSILKPEGPNYISLNIFPFS
jgi:2'-5' RNA ligase